MVSGFIQEMIVLYIIAGIGFIACRKRVFSPHLTKDLTQLILNFTLPFLILYSMGQPYSLHDTGIYFWLIPISTFILIGSIGIASILKKSLSLPNNRKSVFEGLIIFGNQGFIGFALVWSLFPEEGALYVSLYNLPYLILIWTYGIYLFVGKEGSLPWRKLFLNPGILSTIVGLIIFLLPLHWPPILANLFQMVGSTTIPLSMLLIGCLLANMDFKHSAHLWKDSALWLMTLSRLILIPGLLFVLLFFSLPFPLVATALLVSATPAAPTVALYAEKYGGDIDFAAIGSAFTTLVAIFTIPALYLLLILFY